MHKSRLAGFVVDCQTDDLDSAAAFWSEALGLPTRQLPPDQADKYIELVDPTDVLHIELQSVSHPSRVHLDIETDDIEAEVNRLEAAGANRLKQVGTWWVMEAPTGQRFCVVRPQSSKFDELATEWN